MELLIYKLIRVCVISVRYFCLINDVLCDFVWFSKIYQMYIYCIYLFMSLFIIPSQSIIGKILQNLWQRHLEKPLLSPLIAYIIADFQSAIWSFGAFCDISR